jgi:hypothetical protein
MSKLRLFILLLFATISALSPSIFAQEHYAEDLVGDWKGMMHVYRMNEVVDSVAVEMQVRELIADSI